MRNDCPFCNSKVTSGAFATESSFLALYNHAPVVPGHSLIIPKRHVTDIFDLSEKEYLDLFSFARKVTLFLNKHFLTNEFDLSLQQGENAGQSVGHIHLHIIPRHANDLPEGEEWFHKLNKEKPNLLDSGRLLDNQEMKHISDLLRQEWQKTEIPPK